MPGSPDLAQKSNFLSSFAGTLHSALNRSILTLMVALTMIGCRLSSQEGLQNPNWGDAAPAREETSSPPADQPLIKPMIPPERRIQEASPPQQGQPPQPVRVVIEPKADSNLQKVDWEDEKIKTAAIEMARATPSVKKMKICLDIKHNEWWAILYEDSGAAIELRQFVWSREQKRFEPHLVLDRIPRSQLEKHVAESEPGRACEAVDIAPKP